MFDILLSKKYQKQYTHFGEISRVAAEPGSIDLRRYGHEMVSVGTDLYILGGRDENNLSRTLTKFNTLTDEYEALPLMPTSVNEPMYFGAVVIGTKIYVCGRSVANEANSTFKVFDTVSKTWSSKTTLNPFGSNYGSVFVTDGTYIYQMGGFAADSGNSPNETNAKRMIRYHPDGDTFVELAPLPTGRYFAAGGYHDGKIYNVGGPTAGFYEQKKVYEYDIASDVWRVSEMTAGEDQMNMNLMRMVVVNGHLFVFGGYTSLDVYECMPEDEKANRINGALDVGRVVFGACAIGDKIWMHGGNAAGLISRITEYDPNW